MLYLPALANPELRKLMPWAHAYTNVCTCVATVTADGPRGARHSPATRDNLRFYRHNTKATECEIILVDVVD